MSRIFADGRQENEAMYTTIFSLLICVPSVAKYFHAFDPLCAFAPWRETLPSVPSVSSVVKFCRHAQYGTKRSLILSLEFSQSLDDSRAVDESARTKPNHLVAWERCWNFTRFANALWPKDLRRGAAKARNQNSKNLVRQRVWSSDPDQRTFKMPMKKSSVFSRQSSLFLYSEPRTLNPVFLNSPPSTLNLPSHFRKLGCKRRP
jgi:hypothetical protein